MKALEDANRAFKNKIPINFSAHPTLWSVSPIGEYAYVLNIDLNNQTVEVVFRYKDVYDKVMEYQKDPDHKEIRIGGEYTGTVESDGVCKINKILAFRLLTNY